MTGTVADILRRSFAALSAGFEVDTELEAEFGALVDRDVRVKWHEDGSCSSSIICRDAAGEVALVSTVVGVFVLDEPGPRGSEIDQRPDVVDADTDSDAGLEVVADAESYAEPEPEPVVEPDQVVRGPVEGAPVLVGRRRVRWFDDDDDLEAGWVPWVPSW